MGLSPMVRSERLTQSGGLHPIRLADGHGGAPGCRQRVPVRCMRCTRRAVPRRFRAAAQPPATSGRPILACVRRRATRQGRYRLRAGTAYDLGVTVSWGPVSVRPGRGASQRGRISVRRGSRCSAIVIRTGAGERGHSAAWALVGGSPAVRWKHGKRHLPVRGLRRPAAAVRRGPRRLSRAGRRHRRRRGRHAALGLHASRTRAPRSDVPNYRPRNPFRPRNAAKASREATATRPPR